MNFDKLDHIQTQADFVRFVGLLVEDLRNNAEGWENRTLPEFLEGMASWVEDMEGYYANTGQAVPQDVNWRVFADVLMGGRVYE